MPAKLVAIGDSLTQGFQSGAISNTAWSYPSMLAKCLGANPWRAPDFSGEGGLPLNIESLVRMLDERYGSTLNWWEVLPAALSIRSHMDRVEDYWERGLGTRPSGTGPLHHNLAVWGFELGDCDDLTEALCRGAIPRPSDDLFSQIPEFPMYRTARRTLNPSLTALFAELTQLTAAEQISSQEGGIENLIFSLGANNCLGTVTSLQIRWSETADLHRPAHLRKANLWTPEHFQILLDRVCPQVAALKPANVFIGTVPHVTIPPVSRGISMSTDPDQQRSADGYYEFYTHFWVWDDDFRKDPEKYRPFLTRDDARRIDEQIDAYNGMIRVQAARHGWGVIDWCGLLDSLAYRRSAGKPTYQFPAELVAAVRANPATAHRFTPDGRPILDTRYLGVFPDEAELDKKYRGGIFSLDGIHPTTIGYGIMAHTVLEAMKGKGIVPAVPLDWNAVVAADQLVTNLPRTLDDLEHLLGGLSKHLLPLMHAIGGNPE